MLNDALLNPLLPKVVALLTVFSVMILNFHSSLVEIVAQRPWGLASNDRREFIVCWLRNVSLFPYMSMLGLVQDALQLIGGIWEKSVWNKTCSSRYIFRRLNLFWSDLTNRYKDTVYQIFWNFLSTEQHVIVSANIVVEILKLFENFEFLGKSKSILRLFCSECFMYHVCLWILPWCIKTKYH